MKDPQTATVSGFYLLNALQFLPNLRDHLPVFWVGRPGRQERFEGCAGARVIPSHLVKTAEIQLVSRIETGGLLKIASAAATSPF